jgi:2-polyprenyl-6-methoxyphenol hydroxylase-like FAD-dependent oxidoreductase
MIPAEGHYPVLIVGAGPSGLMMAAQLLRYGIQPLIIDSKIGPTNQSRALAVQARSMEIYRQMGLANKILSQGASALEIKLHENQQEIAFLSLKNIGEGMSKFPYIQIYEQSKNERLLLDYLTLNCCRVYWNTTLKTLTETANHTEVVLADENTESHLTCDWLVGADGARSLVRKGLNISFDGDTYPQKFYLADLQLEAGLDENQVNLFLGDASFNAFFPMNGKGKFRLIGKLPQHLKEDANFEEVLSDLQKQHFNLKVLSCNWFSTYNLHQRMAKNFATKKSFLIGDAAHVHSPVGGQGMNTGLQDAYNLGWKLAGVIKNQIKPRILLSYVEERMPVARTLLKTTDRAFAILISDNFMLKVVRKLLIKYLTGVLWKKPKFRNFFFKVVSQIAISYRSSNINLNLSKAENIKAGDRLPFIKIFDEKKHQETDLHAWCTKPGFTFIALGKLKENDLFNLARWITQNYPQQLNFFYLPFSQKNKAVFDCFEMKEDQHKAIIVRPDMYIGYLNDTIHVDLIDDYLEQVAGCIKINKKQS